MLSQEQSNRRLLIVEDYAPMRFSLETEARECGHFQHVHALGDGESAKEYIENCLRHDARALPDIVLSDLYMNGVNGIELLTHVRLQTATAHIFGVLMSGGNDRWEREAARSAGCTAFLQKPTTEAGLRDFFEALVRLAPTVHQPEDFSSQPRCTIEKVGCSSSLHPWSEEQVAGMRIRTGT